MASRTRDENLFCTSGAVPMMRNFVTTRFGGVIETACFFANAMGDCLSGNLFRSLLVRRLFGAACATAAVTAPYSDNLIQLSTTKCSTAPRLATFVQS